MKQNKLPCSLFYALVASTYSFCRFCHSEAKTQPGGAEGAQASTPLAIRILMFIFLVFHQHCKSRSGSLQNVIWQKHKQNSRQEVVNRGIYVCVGGLYVRGLDIQFWQISLIYCFIFQFVWASRTQAPPRRRDWPLGSNTFVIKPSGYWIFEIWEILSSFLHSCVVCTTIYNKNWVLPCSASVETSLAFELPTVSIDA